MPARAPMPPPAPASSSASHGPFLPRLFNAILLRRDFYNAVAADGRATGGAGAIVCLVALARESPAIHELGRAHSLWGVAAAAVVLVASAGWVVYGSIAYAIARLVAPGPLGFKAVLRCLGYTEAVTVLRLLALFVAPLFYAPLHLGLLAWSFAAVMVAMRAATGASGVRLWLLATLCFVAQQVVLAVERLVTY